MSRRGAAALALAILWLPALAGATAARPVADPALVQVELAHALRQAGDRRGADEALDRALEIDPRCGAAWIERGLLEESKGSSYFTRARARRAFARAFELDPGLADPLRHPEIIGSRAALAATVESWRRPPSAEAAATPVAAAPSTPATPAVHSRPVAPAAARSAQVLGAGDLAGSSPVNQALPAGSGAPARSAPGRRGARLQRFHPPPVAQPEPEPEQEPVIENEEAPPPEESGDPASDEPPTVQTTDESGEEPPPGLY